MFNLYNRGEWGYDEVENVKDRPSVRRNLRRRGIREWCGCVRLLVILGSQRTYVDKHKETVVTDLITVLEG